MIENNDNMHKKEIRFDSIGKIKTSLYSSPIEDEILQEMGFELEKLVDEPGFLANFVIDDNRDIFCSDHKVVVPKCLTYIIEQSVKICEDNNTVIAN